MTGHAPVGVWLAHLPQEATDDRILEQGAAALRGGRLGEDGRGGGEAVALVPLVLLGLAVGHVLQVSLAAAEQHHVAAEAEDLLARGLSLQDLGIDELALGQPGVLQGGVDLVPVDGRLVEHVLHLGGGDAVGEGGDVARQAAVVHLLAVALDLNLFDLDHRDHLGEEVGVEVAGVVAGRADEALQVVDLDHPPEHVRHELGVGDDRDVIHHLDATPTGAGQEVGHVAGGGAQGGDDGLGLEGLLGAAVRLDLLLDLRLELTRLLEETSDADVLGVHAELTRGLGSLVGDGQGVGTHGHGPLGVHLQDQGVGREPELGDQRVTIDGLQGIS